MKVSPRILSAIAFPSRWEVMGSGYGLRGDRRAATKKWERRRQCPRAAHARADGRHADVVRASGRASEPSDHSRH